MPKKKLPPSRRRPPDKSVEDLPLWPHKVERGALVEELRRHVAKLRSEKGHGNRKLFLDDVFVAYLLAFFNPTVRTLRTLEDFSQSKGVRKHLSIEKIARSTLSDFNKIADPERLGVIFQALRSELSKKCKQSRLPADLQALHKQIRAVDGTFLHAAAGVAWALKSRNQRSGECHRARLDFQVDIATWIPDIIVVPDPGESEADSAARQITPGTISVYDRAFMSFHLIDSFHDRDPQTGAAVPRAEFVIRLKKPGGNAPTLVEVADCPLDADAQAAGVESDRLVRLPGLEKGKKLHVTLREVVVAGDDGKPVRLLTNLLTVPAHVVALLYKYRWQVELFFKWMKCYGHFNHLISHNRGGVLLNFYVTVIGVLLLYLHTGFRPNKYAMALLSRAVQGASLDEIMPILRERERQSELARQSAARRRLAKKNAGI
jgi:hypothetical protein